MKTAVRPVKKHIVIMNCLQVCSEDNAPFKFVAEQKGYFYYQQTTIMGTRHYRVNSTTNTVEMYSKIMDVWFDNGYAFSSNV